MTTTTAASEFRVIRSVCVQTSVGCFELVRTNRNTDLPLEVYSLNARGYRGIPRYIGTLNQHPAMWELLYEYDCAVRGWSGIPPYHRAA